MMQDLGLVMICINISGHLQTALKNRVLSKLQDLGLVVVCIKIPAHLQTALKNTVAPKL